jgi:peptidoglycan/xylan/chitin deacetylase (PgdA/CDA1 family)
MKKIWKKTLMFLLTMVLLISQVSPAFAAAQPTRGKVVAMTFDDGPSYTVTPKLLDELAARNVKCTFFMLGQWASVDTKNVLRAYNEGHQIASHTYSHLPLSGQNDDAIRNEVERTRLVLESITGQRDFMVRLPFGDGTFNSRVLNCVNAPVIFWSVDATNGQYPCGEEKLYQGILDQIHDGAIILMHDTTWENMRAAIRAIDTLQAQGWSFVTVEELFRLKGVNPQKNTAYSKVTDAGTAFDESNLSGHWAYESIQYVRAQGIMEGDGIGFKPNEYLTRGMAATLLWRLAGRPSAETTNGGFSDVPEHTWYSEAVAWGRENNIINGYNSWQFAPADLVSREQFCALLQRFAIAEGERFPALGFSRTYSDADRISGWAKEAVEAVMKGGFVSKNDTSIFRPRDSLTRAEAAELLAWYKML